MNKFNLKSSLILNKKFAIELSGYSASEVDQFLDKILGDYRIYEELTRVQQETIIERGQVIADKNDEIQTLNIELSNLKAQLTKSIETSNPALYEEIRQIKKKLR